MKKYNENIWIHNDKFYKMVEDDTCQKCAFCRDKSFCDLGSNTCEEMGLYYFWDADIATYIHNHIFVEVSASEVENI